MKKALSRAIIRTRGVRYSSYSTLPVLGTEKMTVLRNKIRTPIVGSQKIENIKVDGLELSIKTFKL